MFFKDHYIYQNTHFRFALLILLASVFIRLYFFGGYGVLADDINDVHITRDFLNRGSLNPEHAHHYRMLALIPRAISFSLFGENTYSMVLPIFLYALGAMLVGILFANDLFGGRGALVYALVCASTPFENLTSTLNAPDYGLGFFLFLASWQFYRVLIDTKKLNALLASLSTMAAILTKISGFGIIPVFGLVSLCFLKLWKRWIWFWLFFLLCIFITCIWDYSYSGHFFRWFYYNNFFDGAEVSHEIFRIWWALPRYMFQYDDYGNLLFGLAAWLSLTGLLYLISKIFSRKLDVAAYVVIFSLTYFTVFNFSPHKFTLDGYYSHWRVFRYLAAFSPFLYLIAVFGIDNLLSSCSRYIRYIGWSSLTICCFFGILTSPEVSRSSWDSARDGKLIVDFFRDNPPPKGIPIYTDQWKCGYLQAMWSPEVWNHPINCMSDWPQDNIKRAAILRDIPKAIVITGGSTTGWYGNTDLLINLQNNQIEHPKNWRLVKEFPGEKTKWRIESVRIWQVQ